MMRPLDLLRLSTRMFKTRPLRTLLTILGVGVGIGAIVFLVSLGYGLQKLLLDKITTSESLLSLDVTPPESGIITIRAEQLKAFSGLPNVVEVSPVANISSQVSIGQFTGDALVNVVKPSYFRLSGTEVKYGRLLSEDDHGKVIVTSTVAKLFNLKPSDAVGKRATFTLFYPTTPAAPAPEKTSAVPPPNGGQPTTGAEHHQDFDIVGVIVNDASSLAYVDFRDVPDLPVTEYASAKVRVDSDKNLESVRDKVKEMGFNVFALSDTIADANKIFQAIQIMLALFGIVALFVAAIGMFNTVTIALLERTQEIGIMKAIGAGNVDIFIMFLTESALMGFLGGVSGVLIGYFGGTASNLALNFLASRLGGQSLDLFVRPFWFIAGIIIFSTVVGFLTGVLPSRRAARLNTLEALRYK